MKRLAFFALLILLSSCAQESNLAPPIGQWTYPPAQHELIKNKASRKGADQICRLTGWDEVFYYFDWAQPAAAIRRGTAKVNREQFAQDNGGALTLKKGRVTVKNGQIRTVEYQ